MKMIVGTILLITNVCFAADNPQIDTCLGEAAAVSSDSGVEDRMRLSCLQNNKQGITLGDCKQLKTHIVDSKDAATVADVCFRELKNRVGINECFEVAAWNNNIAASENLALTCLRENSPTISSVQCFEYAQKNFNEPSTSSLASVICADNLMPSPLASSANDYPTSIEE